MDRKTPAPATRTLRFSGADRFVLLLDHELRRAGATGFQAAIGVELEGKLDRPRFLRAFDEVRRAHPRMQARLVPARGLADWHLALDRSRLTRDDVAWSSAPATAAEAEGDLLLRLVAERARAPLDPTAAPLVDLAVRELPPARTLLALRFWHPIFDERGGELVLRELAAAYAGEPPRAGRDEPPQLEAAPWRERNAAFRRARARLTDLTPAAPFQLPKSPRDAPAEWLFERTVVDPAATSAWLAGAQEAFGPASEGLAQLATVARVLAAGAPDDAWIALPLTVQLRAPRARAPVAANVLSFLWYAFRAGAMRAPGPFAAQLFAIAREKVATGEERDAVVLLDRASRMPLSIYRRELVRRDGGSRFSATLSTIGEVLNGVRELFGLPLRDFVGLPVFPSPPGLGFAFSRAAGRLSFVTGAWTRDVARADAAAIHRRIAKALARPWSGDWSGDGIA